MAFTDPVVIGDKSYTRICPGEYFQVDSTVDEPKKLWIQSRTDKLGAINAMAKLTFAKNDTFDLTLPDDILSTHVVLRANPRYWPQGDIETILARLATFQSSPANVLRLMRGEI